MLGGVAVSLARGAWLGLATAVAYVGGFRLRVAAQRALMLSCGAIALLPILLATADTPFLDELRYYVQQRLTTLDPQTILDDNTVSERLDTYIKAQEGIADHPWIGNGTGSFGQRYYYQSVAEPAWVGNLELHLLYDTGLWGTLAFFGCLACVAAQTWRAYRRNADPEWRALLLALTAGGVVLFMAYQATEATWLALTWTHLGLLRAAAGVRPESAPA
jgi:O-antigen ligase